MGGENLMLYPRGVSFIDLPTEIQLIIIDDLTEKDIVALIKAYPETKKIGFYAINLRQKIFLKEVEEMMKSLDKLDEAVNFLTNYKDNTDRTG